jgi:hypothetical protein
MAVVSFPIRWKLPRSVRQDLARQSFDVDPGQNQESADVHNPW